MFSASNEGKSHLRLGACVLRYESVLLPLLIPVGLGGRRSLLPDYRNCPSFDYWLNVLDLSNMKARAR